MEITLNAANKQSARHQVRGLVKNSIRVRVEVIRPSNKNQTTLYEGTYKVTIQER